MTADEAHQAIAATFRIERARLIAGLARLMRNIDLAEELAQDAPARPVRLAEARRCLALLV
jgi:predicted RNA polymerase sigma factor